MEVEERTLIKQGGGGYTIYLPKKWVDSKGLKEKDTISVEERNGMLVLKAKMAKRNTGSIIFDKNNMKDARTLLTHFYREGCDEIVCENVDSKILSEIMNTINKYLLAFEIVERDGSKCVIGNISEPENQKYDVILRRVFLLAKETIVVLNEDAKNGKFARMNEMQDMKDQMNKFVLFCRRIIVKEQLDHSETLSWEMLTFINYIQHAAYYLYKYANEKKVKLNKNLIKLIDNAVGQFELYKTAYYDKDITLIHKIHERKEDFRGNAFVKLIDQLDKDEIYILMQIKELHRFIQVGTSPLISMILEEQLDPLNKLK